MTLVTTASGGGIVQWGDHPDRNDCIRYLARWPGALP
jgi:hypothetical protein